ncbi:MAG TPA: hypothetical protein VN880_04935 [Solirubrobacteraceae bacterium]|nr:hypothetical protein [Solirubrobacteraceae bacterium]
MPDSANTATKGGIAWGIGNDEDVAWVRENTASEGSMITVTAPGVRRLRDAFAPGGRLGGRGTER